MANLSTLRFLAEQQQYAALRQACLEEAEAAEGEAARAEVARMCEGLLANTVIEKYSIEIA